MDEEPRQNIIEQVSSLPFDDTLSRLEAAITRAGMTIFCRIDHAANARDSGLSMPPTTVLIYGSPKGGTPIMLAAPAAALDLPLHVLVRERANGTTVIAFHPIVDVLRDAGVPQEAAARLEPAQALLVKAVTS
jgi:uncharacterized protein (DUF302 family)